MMPIAPLMIEHRLIERMIEIIRKRVLLVDEENGIDPLFVANAVDFIRVYADRCHHGKEEDILFRDLETKKLAEEHRQVMGELIEDHRKARSITRAIVEMNHRYTGGETSAIADILAALRSLVEMYSPHIEKEDKHFFLPCMDYFTYDEQERMLREEWEFDRTFIHQIYRERVVEAEKKLADGSYRAF